MSASQQGNQNPPTWTEPPWSGWIETTGDALLILEAARRGLIPRVTRRLVDSERKMITSGSVFVFDEDESGIKRWTDGFFWSPSRILGNFLLYRETDKRGSGHRSGKDIESNENDGSKNDGSLSRPKSDPGQVGVDKHRERTLVGSLTNSYKFKPDGLMKKTFSVTIGGVAQHLISYYKIEDVESGRLRSPSSLPELASLEISQEYLDKTHFRNPPKVEMGADGILRYRGEADDIDTSPTLLTGPPLTELPLITEGRKVPENAAAKRPKRFDPLLPAPKRRRAGNSKGSPVDPQQAQAQQEGNGQIASPTAQQQIQAQGYPDPNTVSTSPPATAAPTPSYTSFGVAPYYPVHGYMQPPPPHVSMYPHQAPYPGMPQTQPPPTHPAQYPYPGYPVPVPGSALGSTQASPPSSASTNTPISPSDSSHPQVPPPFAATSPTQTQPQPQPQPQQPGQPQAVQMQPGYYHHPPHPYYPAPPHAPAGQPVYTPYPPPPHAAHAPPPPPTAVWPPPHPHPHAYAGYPPPPPPPQQYSFGMYGPPPQQPYIHPHPQGYNVYAQKPEHVPAQGQAQGAMDVEGKAGGGRAGGDAGEESGE